MPVYKAFVTDRQTGKSSIIESEYPRKDVFIRDLRRNGYTVNPYRVKTKAEFERIMRNTNANRWDWATRVAKKSRRMK